MINLIKVISSDFDDVKRRVVKLLRLGYSDVQTSDQANPHGIDSNPVKDMIAVYAETAQKGETVIIGYLNKDQLAEPGETRIYSTDANGVFKTSIWLKADGTIEVGGNTKNLVRYQELEAAFNELTQNFNAFVEKYNAHTHSGATAPIIPAAIATQTTADISQSKIEEIKTL